MERFPQDGQSREALVDSCLAEFGNMVLDQVRFEYGIRSPLSDGQERGWLLCGAMSVALSRLLSYRTGVPVGRGLEGVHFSLDTRYFYPSDAPEEVHRLSDHTFVLYHTGQGTSYYLDAVYPVLWNDVSPQLSDLRDVVIYEPHPTDRIGKVLEEKYALFPFDEATPESILEHPFVMPGYASWQEIDRFIDIANAARAEDIGRIWGGQLVKAIRMVEPDWDDTKTRITEPGPDSYSRPQYPAPAWVRENMIGISGAIALHQSARYRAHVQGSASPE
jgi:hypothetical protein